MAENGMADTAEARPGEAERKRLALHLNDIREAQAVAGEHIRVRDRLQKVRDQEAAAEALLVAVTNDGADALMRWAEADDGKPPPIEMAASRNAAEKLTAARATAAAAMTAFSRAEAGIVAANQRLQALQIETPRLVASVLLAEALPFAKALSDHTGAVIDARAALGALKQFFMETARHGDEGLVRFAALIPGLAVLLGEAPKSMPPAPRWSALAVALAEDATATLKDLMK